MSLYEFLSTRIAEDRATAQTVVTAHEWRRDRDDEWHRGEAPSGVMVQVRAAETAPDPKVLAECEAKRRIVEECERLDAQTCDCGAFDSADIMLRALAAIYSDHPDYDPAWRH